MSNKKIEFEKPFGFSASDQSFKILKLLNYKTISDYEVSQNPKIIDEYDKIIFQRRKFYNELKMQ